MARPPDTDGGLTAYLDALVGEITAGRQPPATSVAKLGRRDFIKLSGLAGGGLEAVEERLDALRRDLCQRRRIPAR